MPHLPKAPNTNFLYPPDWALESRCTLKKGAKDFVRHAGKPAADLLVGLPKVPIQPALALIRRHHGVQKQIYQVPERRGLIYRSKSL